MHLPAPLPSPPPLQGARVPPPIRGDSHQKSHTSTGFLASWKGSDLSPSGSPSWASCPQAALASGVPREPRLSQNLLPPCRTFLSSGFWGGCLTEVRGRPWGWHCQCGAATSSPSPVLAPPTSCSPHPVSPSPLVLPVSFSVFIYFLIFSSPFNI